jgi:hypothetical protein
MLKALFHKETNEEIIKILNLIKNITDSTTIFLELGIKSKTSKPQLLASDMNDYVIYLPTAFVIVEKRFRLYRKGDSLSIFILTAQESAHAIELIKKTLINAFQSLSVFQLKHKLKLKHILLEDIEFYPQGTELYEH